MNHNVGGNEGCESCREMMDSRYILDIYWVQDLYLDSSQFLVHLTTSVFFPLNHMKRNW